MSDQHFLRGNCQSCGSPVEFPADGIGMKIQCPHCGQETLLSEESMAAVPSADLPVPSEVAAETASAPSESAFASSASRKRSPLLLVALVLAALAAAGGVWYFTAGPGVKRADAPIAKSAATNPSPPSPPTTPATNPPADKPAEPNIGAVATPEAEAAAPKKSIDDLKPGTVTLEKAKAGNLTYAVGTLKNNSDQQRFGVKVELELTDARGNPAGKASDYTQVIEPRQEWRFRALVLDPKGSRAVAGRVSSIKEDN